MCQFEDTDVNQLIRKKINVKKNHAKPEGHFFLIPMYTFIKIVTSCLGGIAPTVPP